MTRSLEDRLDAAIESISISVWLLRNGQDTHPPAERLRFMKHRLAEAQELQAKIEKRDRAKARREEARRRSREGRRLPPTN